MLEKIGYSFLILYNLLIFTSSLNAQPSEFKWEKQAGRTGGDIGSEITVNELDNSFITGSFKDTAAFGSTVLIDTVAPSTPKNSQAIAGDQKVTLSWSQNPETDLSHYQIYCSHLLNGFIPACQISTSAD